MNENIVWHDQVISHEARSAQKKQKSVILWFTGLSGSGKSTIANAVEKKLFDKNCHSYLLDGDNIRHGLNKDLSFSDLDRIENIRRIGEVSKLFVDSGLIVLTAFISPFIGDRQLVRELVNDDEFVEVYIDTPLEVCESRDPKGLYKKARAGEIKNFTGIDSTYEAPVSAEVHVKTAELTIEECAEQVVSYLVEKGYIAE
ncbi:adenylyl-sulfate kinase [Photobacterium sp. DNB23_23_1]